jgi:hypothetical protein
MGVKLEMAAEQQAASKKLYSDFLKAIRRGDIPSDTPFRTHCVEEHLSFDSTKLLIYCLNGDDMFIAVVPPVKFRIQHPESCTIIRQSYDGNLFVGRYVEVQPGGDDLVLRYVRTNVIGVKPCPELQLPGLN